MSGLNHARREGKEEGRQEGLQEGHEGGQEAATMNIARNALIKGLSIEVIHDITGLDLETIKQLS